MTRGVYGNLRVKLNSGAAHKLSALLVIISGDLLMPAVVTYLSSVNIPIPFHQEYGGQSHLNAIEYIKINQFLQYQI